MGRNHVLNTAQVRQAAAMYERGMSRREIAAEFGCSEQPVRNALALLGIRMRSRSKAQHIRQVRKAAAKKLRVDGGAWQWMNPANADRWQIAQNN